LSYVSKKINANSFILKNDEKLILFPDSSHIINEELKKCDSSLFNQSIKNIQDLICSDEFVDSICNESDQQVLSSAFDKRLSFLGSKKEKIFVFGRNVDVNAAIKMVNLI
jgi:hypothetical protein